MSEIVDTRLVLLEADIELRCADLMMLALGQDLNDGWCFDSVTAYMRAAYARGYSDAMESPRPERFFHDNGYQVPKRRAA